MRQRQVVLPRSTTATPSGIESLPHLQLPLPQEEALG